MSDLEFKGCCVTFEACPFVFATFGVSSLPTVDVAFTDWPSQATLLEDFLEPGVYEWTERTSSIEGDLKVGPALDILVHDYRTTAGILVDKRPITWLATRIATAVGYTALTASIQSDDFTIHVSSGPQLGSFPRVIYIGEEAILCDSIATNTITVNAAGRGYYGTARRAHLIELASGSAPLVWKDIPTFYGRKVALWLVGWDDIAIPFWRGSIKNRESNGDETAYHFSCEPLWQRERAKPLGIPSVSTRVRGVRPDLIHWIVDNPGTFSVENNTPDLPSVYPSTAITPASDSQVLPQATINVISTVGFASRGVAFVQTSTVPGGSAVAYEGVTDTTLTGCTGGAGTMATGGLVRGDGLGSVANTLEDACSVVSSAMRDLLRGAAFFNSDDFRAEITTDGTNTQFTLTCNRGVLASPTISLGLRGYPSVDASATSGNPANPRVVRCVVPQAPRVLWNFTSHAVFRSVGVDSVEGLPVTWTDTAITEVGTHTTARYILRGQISDGVFLNCEPFADGISSTGPFISGLWYVDGPNTDPASTARVFVTEPVELTVQLLIDSDHWAYALRRGIIEATGAIQSGIDAASWTWDKLFELVRLTSGGAVARSLILDGASTLDTVTGEACKLTGCGVAIRSGGRMGLFAFHVPLPTDLIALSVPMGDHQVPPSGGILAEGIVNIVSVRGTSVTVTVNDKVSQEMFGANRPVEVTLDGMGGLGSSTAPVQQLVGYIGERMLGLWNNPVGLARVNVSIAHLLVGPYIGDFIEVTEYSIPDGHGERGLQNVRGQVNSRKCRLDMTGESLSFVEYEALLYPHGGLAGHSKAARVKHIDTGTGVCQIDVGYLTESSTATDYAGSSQDEYPFADTAPNDGGTSFFEVGDQIAFYEIDAVTPATPEFGKVIAVDPAGKTITVDVPPSGAMAAVAAAGRCDVESDDYDNATAGQREYAYVADAADDTIGTSADPARRFAP